MNDKLREAAQAALEWLRDELLDTWADMDRQFYKDCAKHTKALEAALAEQKPMLEMNPQKREWVGLTDDEIADIANSCRWSNTYHADFARAIEAKLREKNS